MVCVAAARLLKVVDGLPTLARERLEDAGRAPLTVGACTPAYDVMGWKVAEHDEERQVPPMMRPAANHHSSPPSQIAATSATTLRGSKRPRMGKPQDRRQRRRPARYCCSAYPPAAPTVLTIGNPRLPA